MRRWMHLVRQTKSLIWPVWVAQVIPFTSQKQNAVISGVASVLGEGITPSDITLTVTKDSSQVCWPATSDCSHSRGVSSAWLHMPTFHMRYVDMSNRRMHLLTLHMS